VLGTVQAALGLGLGDLALLAGGVFLVLGALFIGISGNKRGRFWLAALGWIALICAVGALGFGTLKSTGSSKTAQAS